MKTKAELSELKNEYLTICNKLAELTEDELKQVCGGILTKIDGEEVDLPSTGYAGLRYKN